MWRDEKEAGSGSTSTRSRAGRAQAQVGVLLVTLLVVVLIVAAQTQFAAAERAETEGEHATTLIEDMQELQVTTIESARSGAPQSVPVKLGSDYSSFLILSQPANYPWGTLETTEPTEVRIENAQAIDPDAAQYIDGSPRTFETAGLRYTPAYVEREEPPTLLRNGMIMQRGEGTLTGATIVDGVQINLIATDGEINETSQRESIIVAEPLSTDDSSVPVESTNGEPIEIQLETGLSEAEWESALSDEIDAECSGSEAPYVCGVSVEDSVATITLAPGPTYQLNSALVGYRSVEQPPAAAGDDPEAVYLTRAGSTQVGTGEMDLTVEARDRFSNPVAGATVVARTADGRLIDSTSTTTGSDGRATFRYEATRETGTVEVTIRLQRADESYEEVTYEFEVEG